MRAVHAPGTQRQRADRPGRGPQRLDDPGRADDIGDRVQRADLVELDLVHADAVHLGFGLRQDVENRAGARGDRGIQAHGCNRGADRCQPDMGGWW